MTVSAEPFRPPRLVRGAHLQTMLANLLPLRREASLPGFRLRTVEADDGEPLVCRVSWQDGPREASPGVVLVHGMEGSAESPYVVGLARKLVRAGYHVCRMNQRGCGDGRDVTPTLYHAGRDDDVRAVVDDLREAGVERIGAIGFSLGGQLVLRMAGRAGSEPPAGLEAVCAVSPAVDLGDAIREIERPGNLPYHAWFIGGMHLRIRRLARLWPGRYEVDGLWSCLSVRAFDDRYTAPQAGYDSAEAYYDGTACLHHLDAIRVPTLVLHAADDPLCPVEALRTPGLQTNPAIDLVVTPRGGHVAFWAPGNGGDGFWAEDRVVEWLEATFDDGGREIP